MHFRRVTAVAFCAMWVLALGAPAAAQVGGFDPNNFDVYKDGVPDTDKPGVPPPPGPAANDNSCWMACAANLLGGAGYGSGGAAGIYNTLRNDLGFQNMGCAEKAINYWLYTYGKNPVDPEFQPNNAYTDVTVVEKLAAGLTLLDYNFLLDELKRCQYVAVKFDLPPHCMTLVGGDYANVGNPNQGGQSIWHDSDRDNDPTGNDVYTNDFVTNGTWDLLNYYAYKAQKYVTLCPGLNKPQPAMMNYDVAYFMNDPTKTENWAPYFREAGAMAPFYMDPIWDPAEPNRTVIIGNEVVENKYKEIWLLVDYKDRDPNRAEQILLMDDSGLVWAPTVTDSNDGGQSLYHWTLDYQPQWEKIIFPTDAYKTLMDYVKDWDVSTICVPEPCSVALVALGGLVLIRRRRR